MFPITQKFIRISQLLLELSANNHNNTRLMAISQDNSGRVAPKKTPFWLLLELRMEVVVTTGAI